MFQPLSVSSHLSLSHQVGSTLACRRCSCLTMASLCDRASVSWPSREAVLKTQSLSCHRLSQCCTLSMCSSYYSCHPPSPCPTSAYPAVGSQCCQLWRDQVYQLPHLTSFLSILSFEKRQKLTWKVKLWLFKLLPFIVSYIF